jgi:hypothetical protein
MTDFDPVSLIDLQIRLEYDLDSQRRLVMRPGSQEQASCVVYQYNGGGRLYYAHHLPLPVQKTLQEFDPLLAFCEPTRIDALLEMPIRLQRDIFQAAIFTHCPSPEEYPLVQMEGEAFIIRSLYPDARVGLPVGDPTQPAAIAWSVRQDEQAAEVAVETQLAFRRRGYARQVVAAWAAAQFQHRRVAFYSHKASNYSSLALRRSLGVLPFADSMAWEY